MNTRQRILWIVTAILVVSLALFAGCDRSGDSETEAAQYHCPMHPTVVSDQPGDCPICGMRLVPMEEAQPDTSEGAHSDVPGQAAVSITPETRQTMGLKLASVERRELVRDLRTSARIVADENRLHHVTIKVDGWVDELFASITGQEVRQGEPLLTIYSPDLLSAQVEYITALETMGRLSESSDADARAGAGNLVESARRRLELWDVSPGLIRELEQSRTVHKYVTYYAPMSGVVIERNISAGHHLQAEEVIMTIADLSQVWGDADIYQSDLPYVRVGMPLELSLPYWPSKVFRGKVIFVSPTVNTETRTIRARLEIPNSEMLLRPGMYADAHLKYSLGESLAIPAEAVMFGGEHTYAFRDGTGGKLIPTSIQVGMRAGDYYEVLEGLDEGDRIVVSANFLVDSESSLKAALEAMSGGGAHQGHVN